MKCTQCGAQVEGDFCPYCGTAAEVKTQENNEQQPKIEMPKLSNNSENKAKKPFYKKWWVWVIAAIVIFGIIGKLGGNNGSSVDISEFEWDNMALAEVLPEPASNLGSNLINTEDYLSVDVHEITKDAYKEYVDACREKGFTVEVSEYDGYYDASNEAGFELMLYYFEDEQKMSIDLTAPSEDTNKETEDEKISFTLIAGEVGDYGEKIVFNKGTDMEIERIYYHIPAGTYTVTNVGEYMSQVNVYSDEIHKNEDGWEEPVVAYENQMLDVNKSTSITIDDSQAVYISEPAKFKFEGSIVKSSNNAEGSETSNTDTTDTKQVVVSEKLKNFLFSVKSWDTLKEDASEKLGTDLGLEVDYDMGWGGTSWTYYFDDPENEDGAIVLFFVEPQQENFKESLKYLTFTIPTKDDSSLYYYTTWNRDNDDDGKYGYYVGETQFDNLTDAYEYYISLAK